MALNFSRFRLGQNKPTVSSGLAHISPANFLGVNVRFLLQPTNKEVKGLNHEKFHIHHSIIPACGTSS
jgi:hypothetical protein